MVEARDIKFTPMASINIILTICLPFVSLAVYGLHALYQHRSKINRLRKQGVVSSILPTKLTTLSLTPCLAHASRMELANWPHAGSFGLC